MPKRKRAVVRKEIDEYIRCKSLSVSADTPMHKQQEHWGDEICQCVAGSLFPFTVWKLTEDNIVVPNLVPITPRTIVLCHRRDHYMYVHVVADSCYQVQNVRADGNCLFSALAVGLHDKGMALEDVANGVYVEQQSACASRSPIVLD